MAEKTSAGPDNTAVRVALWRAMHLQIDPPPHVIVDQIGLQLVDPPKGWEERPDMHPMRTSRSRASMVARARFVEDLVEERANQGVTQYVMLGAGLDTFAQRRPDLAAHLAVFEVDQPVTQKWKRERLVAMGLTIPDWLHLVPVDFEANESWLHELERAAFDPKKTSVVSSMGVALYLTKEAIEATLRQVATLAPGSTFVMSFMLPFDLTEPEERPGIEGAARGAASNGTPFISFFSPQEILKLARETGFRDAQHVSSKELANRYFAGRADGLRPSSGEELLVATTGPS
ncbi:MAG: class I SAM-dependent methyltransferase [Polyangiaceae bacterium]